MKILTIHADFIEFEAKKKAFKGAEEGIKEGRQRVEECLVVLTAFEKRDEKDPSVVVRRYIQEIKNIAQQVNAKNIVLYPYAHLSSNLGNPKMAEQILKDAEKLLSDKYNVSRAPFGWYKSFNMSCKGHPLSELSREFSCDDSSGSNNDNNGNNIKREYNDDKNVVNVNLKKEYKDENFIYNKEELTKDQKINLTIGLILAKAVKDLFKEANVGEINFYHDQVYVDFANLKLREDNFKKIASQVQKIIGADLKIEEGSKDNVKFLQQKILNDIGQDKKVYKIEDLSIVPLFKDAFLNNTSEIKAFKLLNLSSAYWKGNQNNEQLIRVYIVGFLSNEKLQEFVKKQESAENRSHLKIGKEQGLFIVSDLVGAGLPLLAPKGTIIRLEIIKFLWDLHKDKGYQQVTIPHIAKDLLYKASGHWDKFGDELFHVSGKYEQFVMKPMNCPHHIQIFDHFSYSYRDMPVRFFEPTSVYRDEKTGQLNGLSRVRMITQDDGHIFCRTTQIKQEVETIVSIILQFYKILGMDKDYWVSLSVRGDDMSKYLGESNVWDIAEKSLEDVASSNSLPFKKIVGEAAFYGPKLDFMFKDALGREWQLATIQLDFNLPERFDLGFMNEKSLKERPVMIHRAISGSIERFMSVLIEHFAGAFPVWLSPVQVKVVTITDRSLNFANEVVEKLQSKNIRVELDARTETMGKKVRDAQIEKVNYIVTIGDKEVEKKNLAVRNRKGENKFDVNVDEFVNQLVDEIDNKKII